MSWRFSARAVIAKVIADSATAGGDVADIMARIDAAYPFGPRSQYPYKVWLEERSAARAQLLARANPDDPAVRTCPACGAKPGRPCVELGAEPRVRRAQPHEARVVGGRHGPLFGAAT